MPPGSQEWLYVKVCTWFGAGNARRIDPWRFAASPGSRHLQHWGRVVDLQWRHPAFQPASCDVSLSLPELKRLLTSPTGRRPAPNRGTSGILSHSSLVRTTTLFSDPSWRRAGMLRTQWRRTRARSSARGRRQGNGRRGGSENSGYGIGRSVRVRLHRRSSHLQGVPYLQGPETWYESKGTENQTLRHGLETIRATA